MVNSLESIRKYHYVLSDYVRKKSVKYPENFDGLDPSSSFVIAGLFLEGQ